MEKLQFPSITDYFQQDDARSHTINPTERSSLDEALIPVE
jgi:hypothetical protein